jgi:hypothetical protein
MNNEDETELWHNMNEIKLRMTTLEHRISCIENTEKSKQPKCVRRIEKIAFSEPSPYVTVFYDHDDKYDYILMDELLANYTYFADKVVLDCFCNNISPTKMFNIMHHLRDEMGYQVNINTCSKEIVFIKK